MSFNSFYRAYRQLAGNTYPSARPLIESMEIDRLVSPHKIVLPISILNAAERAISSFWKVSRSSAYQNAVASEHKWAIATPTDQSSVLMAYDFHTTADGRAYLVEINTNAAGFALGELIYQAQGITPFSRGGSPLELLRQSFMAEASAWARRPVQRAVVIDENLPEQKMFVEFVMFKDLLRQWGWASDVCEGESLQMKNQNLCLATGETVELVYNRLTDFYFENPRFATLRRAYVEGLACVTPNPREYLLLADKERLAEMAQPGWLESAGVINEDLAAIRDVLIPTFEPDHFGSADNLWAQRKRLFFKPRRSHGGKAVYRGASVSRKVFERICAEDYIVQEFVPAQSWPVGETDLHMENWKFDLRFYTYRDQIQLALCRSYQGQVTNFSSPFGGLTAVEFR